MANLILLEMADFDVILGMDWLASCHAMVDCHEKVVKVNVQGGKAFFSKVTKAMYKITSSLCLVHNSY